MLYLVTGTLYVGHEKTIGICEEVDAPDMEAAVAQAEAHFQTGRPGYPVWDSPPRVELLPADQALARTGAPMLPGMEGL